MDHANDTLLDPVGKVFAGGFRTNQVACIAKDKQVADAGRALWLERVDPLKLELKS